MNGAEVLIPIIMFIGFFSTLIILGYIFRISKHKERMELIKHGKDAGIFKERHRGDNGQSSLKWGMVAFFGGMGLIVGSLLEKIGWQPPVAYFAPLLIFGGGALVGYYFFIQSRLKRDTLKEFENADEIV
jgi:hypothetical protein